MVLPEDQTRAPEAEDFYRRSLLLLAEIRDYNRRMCLVMEHLLGPQSDDPRYKKNETWR